ncbi:hypothetical protein ABZ419_22890 [Streptomyces cinnamoneus]|uniref:hypothetical protein n=1 Tax=Streptomyces cinnamoneus TaxID=53446 RepID=UPI0033D3231D
MNGTVHADVLAAMERDYLAWLEQGGLRRLAEVDGRDLEDPAAFGDVVGELALASRRAAYAGVAGEPWADLLGDFVRAVHGRTLQALDAETALMAASLDGSHAGGCG